MSTHYPVLIPLLPLSAGLLSLLLSKLHKNLGEGLVILSLLGSMTISALLLNSVVSLDAPLHYWMGNWSPPIGIEFVVDSFNATVVLIISILAFFASIYAHSFVAHLNWLRIGGFYSLVALLTVGLLGMTLTGDIFNLYVFLEISSLSCYGLIALGGDKGVIASYRYLLVGTVGASLYLLAIGILYAFTGTLNMNDLASIIPQLLTYPLAILALVCLFSAFAIKMALFPFHGWQPDAYTYTHPAVAPLITGAMSKVPAYAMLRFLFYIFGINHISVHLLVQVVGICGLLAMLYGSLLAIKQEDLRRMLAYSSVAQIGYIAMGIGIANAYGLSGAVLHIVNHAFMKCGLFFAIGTIYYKYKITDLDLLGGLHKKMPLTAFSIVIFSLSMVGLPPTGGFFSKYYLIMGAWERGLYIFVVGLIISSLLNAIYFLRILEKIFIARPTVFIEQTPKQGFLEAPINLVVPVLFFGITIIVLGFLNGLIVDDLLINGFREVGL